MPVTTNISTISLVLNLLFLTAFTLLHPSTCSILSISTLLKGFSFFLLSASEKTLLTLLLLLPKFPLIILYTDIPNAKNIKTIEILYNMGTVSFEKISSNLCPITFFATIHPSIPIFNRKYSVTNCRRVPPFFFTYRSAIQRSKIPKTDRHIPVLSPERIKRIDSGQNR